MQPRKSFPWILVFQAVAVGVLTVWLLSIAAVVIWGRRDAKRPALAIIVMGAAQYHGKPSPVLRARLDHGIQLWRKGLATRMILTGGTGEGDTTSEAAVGRRYVVERGVPDTVLMLETEGRSTEESMRNAAALVATQASKSVILVSDPFHMLRLSILARRFGLDPQTSPTQTSPISSTWTGTWKYVVGESIKVPLVFILGRSAR
jgi:uncharacterized SAM-binding protein YcdF (DUF218 family)